MSSRHLGAALAGTVAGLAVFAASLLLGYALYVRLWNGSVTALILALIVFAAAGAYFSWLLGVLVFSGVRNATDEAPSQ